VRIGAEAEGVEFQANCSRLLGNMEDGGNNGMEREISILFLVEDHVNDSATRDSVLPNSLSDNSGKLLEQDEFAFWFALRCCRGKFSYDDIGI
jgi:hypothetical protein